MLQYHLISGQHLYELHLLALKSTAEGFDVSGRPYIWMDNVSYCLSVAIAKIVHLVQWKVVITRFLPSMTWKELSSGLGV